MMLQGWHHQGFISQIDAGWFIWAGVESSGTATKFSYEYAILAAYCPDAA